MESKLLWGANLDALPPLIREEFEKIQYEFVKRSTKPVLEIEKVYSELCDLQRQHKLYENISQNEWEEEFVLLLNKKYWGMWKEYRNGFEKGYAEPNLKDDVFNNESNVINRIFSGVYNVFEKLSPSITTKKTDHHPLLIWFDSLQYLAFNRPIKSNEKTFLCIENHFFEYGQAVGKYVKCWDIILNNAVMFKDIFNEYYRIDVNKETTILKSNNTEPDNKSLDEVSKSKKNTLWFKAGILFADGRMDKYWNETGTGIKNEFTMPGIAEEVGLPKAKKYILATFNGYSKNNKNADKNIFNSTDKTDLIVSHLKENGIEITKTFLDKIPTKPI